MILTGSRYRRSVAADAATAVTRKPGPASAVRTAVGPSATDGPAHTTDEDLIRVAGTRWAVEECFQTAKNEVGLDEYQAGPLRSRY
jgi:hypothetical protein